MLFSTVDPCWRRRVHLHKNMYILYCRPLLQKEGTLLPGSPTPKSREAQLNKYLDQQVSSNGDQTKPQPTTPSKSRHSNKDQPPTGNHSNEDSP